MKSYGALRRNYVDQVVEQVAHRHQLSQKEKDLLRNLVFESLSAEVRVPEEHEEAFHDVTVMLQSARHLNLDQKMRSSTVHRDGVYRTKSPIGHPIREKRRHPRVEVNWPLTIRTPQGPVAAVMKDISASGAFVCGREFFQLREEFPLTNIHVRSSRLRLSVGAKVIRSNIHYINDETVSLGMGVRFTGLSAEARNLISTLISGREKDENLVRRTEETYPASKNDKRLEPDSQLVKFEIEPSSYPQVKLFWRSQGEDDDLETNVSFSRELWIITARACEQIVSGMGTSSSKKLRAALSLMAARIASEIEAEDKRSRCQTAYEAFFDSVVEIYNRKDFPKARKGQRIHDMASQVKLQA